MVKPTIATILSCDWGKRSKKRSVFAADVRAREIRKEDPPPDGWEVSSLLRLARDLARHGPVMVGVDVVLGVSNGYWELVVAEQPPPVNFVDWLDGLDARGDFFRTTIDADQWRFDRPWFAVPKGQGGLTAFTRKSDDGFLRRVDAASGGKPVFAVSGIPGTVGSGTREFWRGLIPLLGNRRDFAIWPFDGNLASLTRASDIVLCESYPKLSYAAALSAQLPARLLQLAKTRAEFRQEACDRLAVADWVRDNGVDLGDLAGPRASEDDFDAHNTAAGLLRCMVEERPLVSPDWVESIAEGSMLLAGPVDLGQNATRLVEVADPRPKRSAMAGTGEYPCPIPGCSKVFTGSRSGWDAHVASLRVHPDWRPEIEIGEDRKRAFREEHEDWF